MTNRQDRARIIAIKLNRESKQTDNLKEHITSEPLPNKLF